MQGEIIAGAIAGLGDGRDRHDHDRSRQAARAADRRELRPDRRVALRARIPDQSGTRRAAAAPPGAADAHAGAHLRPRRRAAARHAQSLRPRRRAALRPDPGRTTGRAGWSAPGSRSRTGSGAANLPLYRDLGPANGKGYPEVVQALNGLKSSAVRVNERGEIIVLVAVPIQRFRAVRGALLLSTAGRRDRFRGRGRAAAGAAAVPRARRRHGAALDAARAHHRGAGAAARRRRRDACGAASRRASRFPTSPTGATRSANSPARCAR